MSERIEVPASPGSEGGRETYEAPRLTAVGNARDLLAGASGSITDAQPCPCPGQNFQPGP
jgi:hypothetical protein